MPAPPPAFYAVNVLEDAELELGPDGTVAGKGPERLVDRDLGLECEDAGAGGARVITADRGLDAPATVVKAFLVAGSGYAGLPITVETSADGASWTARGSITPTDDVPQRVPLTPFACPRYARVTITGTTAPVRLTELWLAAELAFTWKPSAGSLHEPQILNVNTVTSASGRGWGVQRGPRRWSESFVMTSSPDTDRAKMLTLLDALADTAKPFWYLTPSNELRWVRLAGPIDAAGVDRSPSGQWDLPVAVIEELP
jgi:hypothetical protein